MRLLKSSNFYVTAFVCIVTGTSFAAGLLKPIGAPQSSISIKNHAVDVVINNGFSRTEVDQVFYNSGGNDCEAIYSFPLPREASLSELSIWITTLPPSSQRLST